MMQLGMRCAHTVEMDEEYPASRSTFHNKTLGMGARHQDNDDQSIALMDWLWATFFESQQATCEV
jgi:hypothetical protein